jgi:hypothetical protein
VLLLLTDSPKLRVGAELLLYCVLSFCRDCWTASPDIQLFQEALMCYLITQELQSTHSCSTGSKNSVMR